MIAQFTRSTTFLVGLEQFPFFLHTDLVERLCINLKLKHGQIGGNGIVRLPRVDPAVFRLFQGFLHGIFPNLTWSNARDRITLVDLAIIAQDLGTISLQYWLADFVIEEGRLFDRVKYCAGFIALRKAYDEETTNQEFFLRKVLVDCYVHFGRDNHFTELINMDKHQILFDLGFWQDFSDRCGWWRKVESYAERHNRELPPKFRAMYYFERHNPLLTRAPAKMTRQGVEISNSCLFPFNRICVEDGKDPLLIHQSLIDTRGDIANGMPPHDIYFPFGWRNAILIYMEWLYHGKVMWETDHLKDLILAYTLDLPRTTHFQNAVISAIVSWCARYAIVPSDADIVLAYLLTSQGSPLRSFMASWAVTHHAEVSVDMTRMPADIAAYWEADVAHEYRVRKKSVEQDLCRQAATGQWEFDPIDGPCFWNGEDLMNEDGFVVGAYYFDHVCKRFHVHDNFDDTQILGFGGMGGRECRDFHGPSDQLPYIVMYLPDGLNKSCREGWITELDADSRILDITDERHWTSICPSNLGWPAFHRRMLLSNSDWLCRRTRDGIAYFLRNNAQGAVETNDVDPRKVNWVRGSDPWGGHFPVYPSDGIPEYSWEEVFEGWWKEADYFMREDKSEPEDDDALKDDERQGGYAMGDPDDNLDNFSLSEGSFPSDDEASDDENEVGGSVDDRTTSDGTTSDGSHEGPGGENNQVSDSESDHSGDDHDDDGHTLSDSE